MVDSQNHGDARIPLVLAVIFLLVVIGGVVDLAFDRPTTLLSFHVVVEAVMVCVSLGAAAYLAHGWYRTQVRLAETEQESERLADEREEWRERAADALIGLGAAISAQFEIWELTPTERKVALMLLKGLSHKRVARITGTSERTVRQHSVSIYKKSGLAGRAELAGFFLEPLPLPEDHPLTGDPIAATLLRGQNL